MAASPANVKQVNVDLTHDQHSKRLKRKAKSSPRIS